MSRPFGASVSSSAKWGCECMVSELRMLSVNWKYLILRCMRAHGYYVYTWHWISLVCMPCVHIDALSLRCSLVGRVLCVLWGWGSSLNALSGPLYFQLPGLLAPGDHSWVPFQALPSADTSCLPKVLLPPQGNPPLLTGWFRDTETQHCVGNPSQGPSKLQSLLSSNWTVCWTTLQFEFSLWSAASWTPEKICFQDHPPESLLHTVSPCQRLFLREASLQQCDFLEMVLAAFWTMTYLKCSMKQNRAGRQIWSWSYRISHIKAESDRQVGLPPSQP